MSAFVAMNNESPSTTSTSSSTTLRPRNRRLISVNDEVETIDSGNSLQPTPINSGFSSHFPSRTASPVPSTHPSRSTSAGRTFAGNNNARISANLQSRSSSASRSAKVTTSTLTTGLWDSWSSLQEIATTLLSNDPLGASKDKQGRAPRRRRPFEVTHNRKSVSTSSPPSQWGPSTISDRQVGAGSQEDRLARLQTKKREALLAANGHSIPDATGKFKRRVSDERISMSAPPTDLEDRDALVYLHHVQKDDTLAGVAIKYSCPAPIFRKANRLWPNDTVQIRKSVYLPVDACGVKGRKVPDAAESFDLLEVNGDYDPMKTPKPAPTEWGDHKPRQQDQGDSAISSMQTSPSMTASTTEDPPWKHESWVTIDGFLAAVQVVRLSRRTLGYFPPSRRKSVSYSDLDTPGASLDLPRIPTSENASPNRSRRNTKNSRSSSASYFAHQLHGPGGVGTLGKDGKGPGPGQDGLNKLFAKHLPDVNPRTSWDSESSHTSGGTGIENVGGAIEGWMRKLATKAAQTVHQPSPGLGGRSGIGDLIELEDAFEIQGEREGDEEDEVDDGDERTIKEGGGRREESRSRTPNRGETSGRHNQETLLKERYPPRARASESPSRVKGD